MKIDPKNVSAQLSYEARGNPPGAHPGSAVGNYFPGLEFNFLSAWRNPKSQKSIEQCFETPQQARHAAATCAAWLGVGVPPTAGPVAAWWRDEKTLDG